MGTAPGQQGKLGSGSVLDDRYRLEEQLGEGGFGTVYRATQLNIGREVAIKVLRRELLAHEEGRARFRREAQMAQRLEHPHTVRLYDIGETKDSQPYMVLQLLRGRSINEVVWDEGPMDAARVRRISTQVLKSLMEAHALGIVHRDIKPENIFLVDFEGEPDYVKVLDFGLAKAVHRGQTIGASLTAYGETVGTPNYMAPEQVRGKPVTARTDLYALGLVMSEMMTGKMVFPGDDGLEVCKAQISREPPNLPSMVLDSPLGPVIRRATLKQPDERYRSATEMLADLDEAFGEPSLAAVAVPPPIEPEDTVPDGITAVKDDVLDSPDDSPTTQMPALRFDTPVPEVARSAESSDTLPQPVLVIVEEEDEPEVIESRVEPPVQPLAPPTAQPMARPVEFDRSTSPVAEQRVKAAPVNNTRSPWRMALVLICLGLLGLGGLALGWWLASWGVG